LELDLLYKLFPLLGLGFPMAAGNEHSLLDKGRGVLGRFVKGLFQAAKAVVACQVSLGLLARNLLKVSMFLAK
jgi:hypothetical protein